MMYILFVKWKKGYVCEMRREKGEGCEDFGRYMFEELFFRENKCI